MTIILADKSYQWQQLAEQALLIGTKPHSKNLLTVPAQQVLLCVQQLLYGFSHHICVYPYSEQQLELINQDQPIDNHIALIVATSGSQAKAKLAQLSYQNITAHHRAFTKIIAINSRSVWLNCMPLSHIAGLMIVYRSWFSQASMILHEHFDALKVLQDIQKYRVTHISLVPRMLFKLLQQHDDRPAPQSLQYVLVGGDKLSKDLYERAMAAHWPVYISYGMTEACSTMALGQHPDKLNLLNGFDTSLDDKACLMFRGEMRFCGYLHEDALAEPDRQWFITQDKVLLQGASLSFIARNDHKIVCGGKNMSPDYIESLLVNANVAGDFAVGKVTNSEYSQYRKIPHQHWGETPILLFCADNQQDINQQIRQLKAWIKANLPTAYQPALVFAVDKIPRNALDKIDRPDVQRQIYQIFETLCSRGGLCQL